MVRNSLVLFTIIFLSGLSPLWGQSYFQTECERLTNTHTLDLELSQQVTWLNKVFNTKNCHTIEIKLRQLKSFSEFLPYRRDITPHGRFHQFKPLELNQPQIDSRQYGNWEEFEQSFSSLKIFKEFKNLTHYNYGAYNKSKQNICSLLREVPSIRSLTVFDIDFNENEIHCIRRNDLKIFINHNFTPNDISERLRNSIYGIKNYDGRIEELYKYKNLSYLGLEHYEGESSVKVLTGVRNLTHLQINIRNIKNTEDIAHLETLKFLSINCLETKFEYVPETLSERKCKNNSLRSIHFLKNLNMLKGLDISWNNISDLSPVLQMYKLKYLIAKKNSVRHLPSLSSLNLKYLDLEGNRIESVSELQKISSLKFLNISNNHITRIEGIANLINLEFLALGQNPIYDIDKLENLPSLKVLNLDSIIKYNFKPIYESIKVLRSIPANPEEQFWPEQLYFENIETFVLKHQPQIFIKNIEKLDFSLLTRLEALSIRGQYLKDYRRMNELKYLKYLDLSSNHERLNIEERLLPESLQHINLSNSLKSYSGDLSHLKRVKTLDLSGNKINFPTKAPLESKSLVSLNLENCNIRSMPILIFPKLKYLNVSNNNLRNIPTYELINLETLFVNKNRFRMMPNLSLSLNLYNLDLGDNLISEVSDLESLLPISRSILRVNLENNRVKDLSVFEKLPFQRIDFQLSGNSISKCPLESLNKSVWNFCNSPL